MREGKTRREGWISYFFRKENTKKWHIQIGLGKSGIEPTPPKLEAKFKYFLHFIFGLALRILSKFPKYDH
jgi:hypothetical protein